MQLAIQLFVSRLEAKYKLLGPYNFTIYLRNCLQITYNYLGDIPPPTGLPVGVAMVSGLPKVLPPFIRRQIRSRNHAFIHVVVSVFYSYKAINAGSPLPDLQKSTISSPRFDETVNSSLLNSFETYIYEHSPLCNHHFDITRFNLLHESPKLNVSAGPSGPLSSLNLATDLRNLIAHGKYETLVKYMKGTKFDSFQLDNLYPVAIRYLNDWEDDFEKNLKPNGLIEPEFLQEFIGTTGTLGYPVDRQPIEFSEAINKYAERRMATLTGEQKAYLKDTYTDLKYAGKIRSTTKDPLTWESWAYKVIVANAMHYVKETSIGQLALKYEAAGKVRVFAMLDSISQWILNPLHDLLFDYLKSLPSDATFDQEKAVLEFAQQNLGSKFWSFDISAATDMIPIQLYHRVLTYIVGTEAADAWVDLFDRPFLAPSQYYRDTNTAFWLRYTRGQPMGALSSWACLATLHHLIVAYAHYKVTGEGGVYPKGKYLVLGDDICFSDEKLANKYLEILTDFGIPVNLKKSFAGATLFNFAARTISSRGLDFSPISTKEILKATTLTRKAELAQRFLARGYIEKGVNHLFRCFFSLEAWTKETKFLSAGTFSPYGRRVLKVLFRPESREVKSPVLTIWAYYPHGSILVTPYHGQRKDKMVFEERYAIDANIILDNAAFNPRVGYDRPFELRLLSAIISKSEKAFDKYILDLNERIKDMNSSAQINAKGELSLHVPHSPYIPFKDRSESSFQDTFGLSPRGKFPFDNEDLGGFFDGIANYYVKSLERRLEKFRSIMMNRGYGDGDKFDPSKYVQDTIIALGEIRPVINPRYYKEWRKLSKSQLRAMEGFDFENETVFTRQLLASAKSLALVTSHLMTLGTVKRTQKFRRKRSPPKTKKTQ